MQVISYSALGKDSELIDPWTRIPPQPLSAASCFDTCNDRDVVLLDMPSEDSYTLVDGAVPYQVP